MSGREMSKAEALLQALLDAVDAGVVKIDSVEIGHGQNPLNDPEPPYCWHDEWLHQVRSALPATRDMEASNG